MHSTSRAIADATRPLASVTPWVSAAMQMSRSVITPTTWFCSSTTGTEPQS
jgi:hypothetical protein